jgi:DNA (cytosine-5)-methyltransferase 1
MGYKLSGFDVIGGVEIDPKMSQLYKLNFKPKHHYLMSVGAFNLIPNKELPKELFDLDVLDGSPPCSSFSISGHRSKLWGKSRKFTEGQQDQVLDDLFFDFIGTAKKLKPKVVVAENVPGLIQGNARGYVKAIFKGFNDIGYECQLFLINAAVMGVPQKRIRTIFVAKRRDLKLPALKIATYKEPEISVNTIGRGPSMTAMTPLTPYIRSLWHWAYNNNEKCLGKAAEALTGKRKAFNYIRLRGNEPSATITGHSECTLHWSEPRALTDYELAAISTFPIDYNYNGHIKPGYVMGMAVPPYMMNRISTEIFKQWFKE